MNSVKTLISPVKLLVICLLCLLSFNYVFAQDTAGVGIRPAIVEDKLEPNENRSYSVELKNLGPAEQTFYLSKRDIIGVEEGGSPIFANSDSELTGYELSEWITLDRDSITIAAGQSQNINFTLKVPENAVPGGHFGAIVVSVEPPEMRTSGASIGYEVANIISMRVAGDVLETAQIRQFSTKNFINSNVDVDFLVRVENEGNTLVKPIGPLEITNMFGKQVANLQFNTSLSGVFPKTTKNYEIKWQDDGTGFGRYEATLSAVYGDEGRKNTMSSTVSFWILPMNIIGPALGVLATLLLLIYFGVKIYIRRTVTIMTSGSSRRLVRSRPQNEFPVLLVFISMLAVTALLGIILLLLFS
jgi:hypothetical protein